MDPALGGNEALIELVKTAHDRGIRVILDASFNHCHPRFFAFQDLINNGPESPLSRLVRRFTTGRCGSRPASPSRDGSGSGFRSGPSRADWPSSTCSTGGWRSSRPTSPGTGLRPMPRINLANPEARRYMLEVAAEWPRLAGIDGWRMDVARYVDPDFWVDFRKAVKDANPESYLIGEFMGDAGAWLQGDRFDATMNYTFRDICLRYLGPERDRCRRGGR